MRDRHLGVGIGLGIGIGIGSVAGTGSLAYATSMAHRYARLFPLRAGVDATRLVLRVPRTLYVLRGAIALVAAPLLGGLVALLMLLQDAGDEVPLFVGSGAAALVGAIAVAFFALSGVFSARSVVRFDRASIQRARDGASVPTASVAAVRVRAAGGLSGFWVLELVDAAGRAFSLNERLPRMWPADHAAIAGEIAGFLGVPSSTPPADENPLGLSENHAALLCYLPIQGIFLVASLWFLAVDRRPFVRFAAKQSLLHFAASLVVLVIVLVAGATPVLLTEHQDGPLRIAAIVWLVVALVAFLAWNLGAHVYACVQAAKGRTWRMPWLRLLLAEPSAST